MLLSLLISIRPLIQSSKAARGSRTAGTELTMQQQAGVGAAPAAAFQAGYLILARTYPNNVAGATAANVHGRVSQGVLLLLLGCLSAAAYNSHSSSTCHTSMEVDKQAVMRAQ
jgi:hypothetical protein